MRLKADLHVHTGEDPHDLIHYSAETLIDAAAQLNMDVLSITCHRQCLISPRLSRYARQRNIVLIPGAELLVEGKHVVALNPSAEHMSARTFAELRQAGRKDAYFIAPHPFYPDKSCLGKSMVENIDLFDAVEYCSLYLCGINPNRKAVHVAKRFGLPLLGTSDTHALPYSDSTFSWIDAEERTVGSVMNALRAGQIQLETRPRPAPLAVKSCVNFARDFIRTRTGERQ